MSEQRLTGKETEFLNLLATGGIWKLKRPEPSEGIRSLIERGYCKLSPERIGPLAIVTGEQVISLTEAGRAALK